MFKKGLFGVGRTGVILSLTLLTACAHQIPVATSPEAPGFFLGLIQGWIAPVAFVISLFDHDVAVYAVPNDGGWYDFGFLLGILSWGGGGAAASR